MSWLGDLWGGDKGGFKAIPLSGSQQTADQYLQDLLNRRLQYPTREVVGMSPEEQQGLAILRQFAQGPTAGYLTGQKALSDIVAGRDVATSPEYASFREKSGMEEANAVNALTQSQQLRGIAAGTPALKQEGQVRRGFAADRSGYLADLVKNELNLRANAAPALASMSTQEPLTRANALMTAGALPRQLSQQEEDAIFESLVQTLMAPYQLQAPVAQSIMGQQRYAYQQPTPSIAMQLLGAAAGGYVGSGGLSDWGSGGGMGGAGRNPSTGIANPTGGWQYDPEALSNAWLT